jgi:predicted transposase/invertase (TIGR01784 family)
MKLARLDNEVFFKKAFTNPIVFRGFVKDIIGIDINPQKIETEKAFSPKVGGINFKYDIFAEDIEKRIIVEIQKVEYDHNFDRFLHYHLQAITEQQRTSEDYKVDKTVYTIVMMTAPYRVHTETKEIYKDEVLISKLNPKNLNGIERKLFNHELIYLNPNYRENDTPKNYKDWLDLVYESIHNSENPKINLKNEAVKKASELISYESITPEELEEAKKEVGRRKVLSLELEKGMNEKANEIAKKMILEGFENQLISKMTELSFEEIDEVRKELK